MEVEVRSTFSFSSSAIFVAIVGGAVAPGINAESLWPVDEARNPVPLPFPLSTVGCEWLNVTVPKVPRGAWASSVALPGSTSAGEGAGGSSGQHYAIADGFYSTTSRHAEDHEEDRKPLRKGARIPTGVTSYVAILCRDWDDEWSSLNLDEGKRRRGEEEHSTRFAGNCSYVNFSPNEELASRPSAGNAWCVGRDQMVSEELVSGS
eukprot:g4781.t1